jgi:hypothetical protein
MEVIQSHCEGLQTCYVPVNPGVTLESPKILVTNSDRSFLTAPLVCYKSAIAFSLAAHLEQISEASARGIAIALQTRLWRRQAENVPASYSRVWMETPGWIYWEVQPTGVARWLQQLAGNPPIWDGVRSGVLPPMAASDLFFVQYTYARCCSLLRLAVQENLIRQATGLPPDPQAVLLTQNYQLVFPNPLPWLKPDQTFRSLNKATLHLLSQLVEVTDYLACQRTEVEASQLHKKALALSQSMDVFQATHQIFGPVNRRDRPLALCCLGWVAATRSILRCVLEDVMQVKAPEAL